MTTREEMALAFAREGYGSMLRETESNKRAIVGKVPIPALEVVIREAVKMADLLIEELKKYPIPH